MNNMTILAGLRAFPIFAILYLVGTPVGAQHLSFERSEIILSEGEKRDVIQVKCAPPVDEVRSAFDEFMDDYYDVNMNTGNLFGKHKIIEGEGIHLDAVSAKEMNLFARIIEAGDQTELSVFGTFGPDVHISRESFPDAYGRMEDLVMQFTTVFIPVHFQNKIRVQRNGIADLRDDISDIEHDIARNERKITRLQTENAELAKEGTNTRGEIEEAKEELKSIKDRRRTTNTRLLEIKNKQ